MNMSAKEVSSLLAQRAESFARHLFPNGKKMGNEFCVGSVQGEAGESLKIKIAGDKIGVWSDFATGEAGDLLDLIALKRNLSLSEAIKEACLWLGVGQPDFEAYKPKKFNRPERVLPSELSPQSPVKKYLQEERKLTVQTLQLFKVTEQGREIILPYYRNGELLQIKHLSLDRIEGKKKIRVEANCEPCLFGWQALPPLLREITLCEGEIDAMTLHQYGFPALSVPFGGGRGAKQQWVEYEFDRLSAFDKIYLCLDNDTEGKAASEELIERLGRHRCFIVELPHKDANECLQAGVNVDEIKACFVHAESIDPVELKSASVFVKRVIDGFYSTEDNKGIKPPWEKCAGKIQFRPDELSVWTGINGHGKSQFLGQIVLHAMQQGARVCVASLELKPYRLLMRLTRQAAGLAAPTVGYIEAIHQWYSDKLWIFDLVGNAKSERLLQVFRYARQRYGIDTFVIDSFMKLDVDEEDLKAQKALLEKICDFKNEHNCHVHLVVHPRKGVDESKCPSKLDAKGTGAITDLADNCFTVWRNKAKEDAINQAVAKGQTPSDELLRKIDCLWICDKQRNGEWEGKLGFWFHPNSFQYLNHVSQKPVQYVHYSNPVNLKI